MSKASIVITGARQHNLKNISLSLPREKLIVVTGLSGSGKSSLAFDTIYAEGQRKYVESLSAYARQFLEQLQKPDVDHIEGLSPAIAIEQRTAGTNPRSTIATTTEIYEFLRLLFANVGHPHCHQCGKPITHQTTSQIVDQIAGLGEATPIAILAPLVRNRKGEFRDVLAARGCRMPEDVLASVAGLDDPEGLIMACLKKAEAVALAIHGHAAAPASVTTISFAPVAGASNPYSR
jgi:excinuclease ABC subunit A